MILFLKFPNVSQNFNHSPTLHQLFKHTYQYFYYYDYYDLSVLVKVGEKIGKPIKIDYATSLVSRGHFARICIEVDLEKPLVSKFELRSKVRRVEYEGIHLICFACGRFNHKKEECLLVQQNENRRCTWRRRPALQLVIMESHQRKRKSRRELWGVDDGPVKITEIPSQRKSWVGGGGGGGKE